MAESGQTDDAMSARRVFLARTALCVGGFLCLGCRRAAAAAQAAGAQAQPDKFSADSKMKFKDVYAFAYTRSLIPILKALRDDVGREKFLPMLQAAASRTAAESVKKTAPPPPKNTLAAWTGLEDEYFWGHVLTMNWVEKTEKAVEIRLTECLWAATFREADAADIGYAISCQPDFATTTAFNPKIRMTRTKTLMQGDDCCNHRYVLEA